MQAENKEIESNALAQQFNRAYEGMKQGPSRGTIIGVAVLLAVGMLALLFYYFYTSSTAADSARWVALDNAVFPQQLKGLMEEKEFEDSPQYRLARFKEARMKLAAGVRELGDSSAKKREEARASVQQATEIYDELAKAASRVPLLHQEALWGAAKGYEALGGSENVAKATALYETLTGEYKNSPLGKDAKKQLDRIGTSATRQNWADLRSAIDKQ